MAIVGFYNYFIYDLEVKYYKWFGYFSTSVCAMYFFLTILLAQIFHSTMILEKHIWHVIMLFHLHISKLTFVIYFSYLIHHCWKCINS